MARTTRQNRPHQTRIAFTVACALLATVFSGGCSRSEDTAGSPSPNDTPSATAAAGTSQATAKAGDHLRAERPWVRATPPNAPVAGGYVTLRNDGSIDDRLLSIRSPDAKRVEIHEMREADGTMQMRQLSDGVPVAAGAAAELKPGGIHLMFVAPTHPYVAGGTVQATLTFAHAPAQTLAFPVQPISATSAPEASTAADGKNSGTH